MRRRTIELCVGLGLLLGPLGYALTLEPEVVEVVEVVEMVEMVEVAPAPVPAAERVTPTVEPEPEPGVELKPESEPEPESAEIAPMTQAFTPLPFAFVTKAGLLLSTDAQPSWGKGRLRAHRGPGEFRAAKRADAAAIPEALWAQRGRTFDLYDAEGKVCTARLGELSILAQHDGPSLFDLYHGSMEDYDEDEYETFDRQDHPPAEIRAKVWAHASTPDYESAWLVAEVVGDGSCQGALWARDSALPPPALLQPRDEPSQLSARRLAAHDASPELAAMKTAYDQWRTELGAPEGTHYEPWETLAREHPATVRTWHDERGAAVLTELRFGKPSEYCSSDPATMLTSLDRVVDGRFEATEHAIDPIAVFDADLDGQYELLYRNADDGEVADLVSETLAQRWDVDEVFYCPC
ncbi:MAG: hypothetical protein KDK70_11045 [Myxococcales bacterium]|nr:hypothetical protein [Myxococcales bacterium]